MNKIKETGGARIGISNVTWPFSTLIIDENHLNLNAAILGNFMFKASDIISIEPHSGFLNNGIRINHKVGKYNKKIIFWTFSNPRNLISRINQTGFHTNTDNLSQVFEKEIKTIQSRGTFPIKRSALILIILIWNLFLFIDFRKFGEVIDGSILGIGAQLGTGFILGICVLLLMYPPIRPLILKEGKKIQDIKKFIYFVILITGILFLQATLLQ